jgi:hypothetical protein
MSYILHLNDVRCTREIKSRISTTKAVFNKKYSFHTQIGLQFKEETGEVLYQEGKEYHT